MQILDNYNKALQEIYDYFDYDEGWTVYPIDDSREMFWSIVGKEDEVLFSESIDILKSENGGHYSNEIMHHRFYPKAVYEGAEYTMIMVDTHTDGNKFLQIFDNSKRVM